MADSSLALLWQTFPKDSKIPEIPFVVEERIDMTIDLDREEDGRWIAEILALPGVLVYSATRDEALTKVKALALRVMADRLDHGEEVAELHSVFAFSA